MSYDLCEWVMTNTDEAGPDDPETWAELDGTTLYINTSCEEYYAHEDCSYMFCTYSILEDISMIQRIDFGKGFNKTALFRMLKFYQEFQK